MIAINLIFLFSFLIYFVKYKNPVVIFLIPFLLNILYFTVSAINVDSNVTLAFFNFFYLLLTSLIFIFANKILDKDSIFHVINKINNILVIRPIHFIVLLISLGVAFILYPEAILSTRDNHEFLMDDAKGGGYLFSLLSIPLALLPIFCTTLLNLLFIMSIQFFIGSKGFIFSSIIMFMFYYLLKNKNNLIALFSPRIFVIFGVFLVFLNLNIRGNDNALEYLIFNYFDYAENINTAINSGATANYEDKIFVLNDFFPGLSRLFEYKRLFFVEKIFPTEVLLGKNPGMLDFEYFFRLGPIIFSIFFFVKYLLILLISRFLIRSFYLPVITLLFTHSFKIFYALIAVNFLYSMLKRGRQ